MKPDHAGLPFRWETLMKVRLSLLALLFALATGTAFAKIAASSVFLSRANNEDKPAKAGDLAAGDLVVIHATPKDNILEADEIKFSVAAAAKRATPAPTKPKP